MQSKIKLCLLAAVSLALPAMANGAAIVVDPNSGSLSTGDTVSFDVELDATSPFYGFSMYLNASAANSFSVTSQATLTGDPITDANFIGSFPIIIPIAGNSPDLGYTSTGLTDIAAGNYSIEQITLSVAPDLAAGAYTISTTTGLTGSEYNDAEGDEFDLPAATYTVFVPEPATIAVLGAASIGALFFRRCSRRTINK